MDWRRALLIPATMLLAVGCSDPDKEGELSPTGADADGELFDPGVDGAEAAACGEAQVTFEKRIPYLVLLVDQSGSMDQDFGNGTRWQVMRDALLDEQDGIVKRLQDEVRFGLALYTSDDGYQGGTCPMLNEVDSHFGNYDAIKQVYDQASPFEDTPTGESIVAVADQLEKIYVEAATPKVIVLATDGHPDTCDEPDPQNGQDVSIAAAQDAYSRGIQTFVLSVGDDVGDEHLQDMANAGQGLAVDGDTKAKFYKALDQQQLADAFDTIIHGVRDCVFTLDGEVKEGFEEQGTVILDGKTLGPDEYKLNNSKELQLLGEACDLIQDGDHELSISFPCGGYDAPPIY